MSETKSPHTGLTRRGFLKTTGALAGAAAVAGTTPTLTALAETPDADNAAEEQVFYSACGGNCGGMQCCRLKGTVRAGKLVQVGSIDTDPDHPTFKTGCVRGQTNPQRLYGTKRNLYPLKRVEGTERGAGQWERISWDEAITMIVEAMKSIQGEYGDSAVAFWHGFCHLGVLGGSLSTVMPGGMRIGSTIGLERLLKQTGATVMVPAADQASTYMLLALGSSMAQATQNQLPQAKTVLTWGGNPISASRSAWNYYRSAKESGTKIVTIDPLCQQNAIESDIYLPIRPATDGLLALAMCNWVIDNDLVDWDFMRDESYAPVLRKQDGSYLRLSDLDLPPEEGPVDAAGKQVAVDAEIVFDEDIGEFTSINKAKKPAVLGSFEVNGQRVRTVYDYVYEHIKEYTIERAAEECDIPIEKIEEVARLYATNKPAAIATTLGVSHHYNSRHNYKDFALLACLTGNLGKPGTFINLNHQIEGEEHGTPLGGKTDVTPLIEVEGAKESFHMTGMYLPEVVKTGKLGTKDITIKMVYNFQGNPLACDCGRGELIEALKALDFFVVADPYMSDTARYADLVLPMAMMWEKEDAAGGYSLFEKAVEPAGECKTDMDVFRLLADGLGFPDLYDKTDEEYIRAALDTPFNRENGFTYDDYKKKGSIVKFADQVTGGSAKPSSKVRYTFYLENPLPANPTARTFDKDIESRPHYEESIEASVKAPEYEKYPLFGFSIHEMYHAQSVFVDVPWMNELRPEPCIKIHEEAAAARGIGQGDTVRVFNDRGYFVCKAVVTKGIRPDCVLLPHGWQTDDFIEGHSQDLTRIDMDPMTGNSCFNEILCEVELYDGGAE